MADFVEVEGVWVDHGDSCQLISWADQVSVEFSKEDLSIDGDKVSIRKGAKAFRVTDKNGVRVKAAGPATTSTYALALGAGVIMCCHNDSFLELLGGVIGWDCDPKNTHHYAQCLKQ